MLPNVIRDYLFGHRWNPAQPGSLSALAMFVVALVLTAFTAPIGKDAPTPGVQLWSVSEVSSFTIGKPVTTVYELAPTRLYRVKSKYDELILEVARTYDIDPALVKAIVHAESAFKSDAISRRGAMGLMQLMPETATRFRVSDPLAPQENIQAGVQYLKYLLESFDWDLQLALAAYNAGPNVVRRFDRVPPYRETQGYVRKVIGLHELYALTL